MSATTNVKVFPPRTGLETAWDAFLQSTGLGQFQQSSGWARVKRLDGWNTERVFIRAEHPDAGGFQLLWKATPLGRIGYVSKGPVVPNGDSAALDDMMERIRAASASLRLRAVIVQPPDESRIGDDVFRRHQFCLHPVESVVRATAVIELAGGRDAFMRQVGSNAKKEARQAVRRGTAIRLGDRADLRLFFELMLGSCHRQKTQPNPSRPELLEALWDAFFPHVWMGLASVGDDTIAGVLLIGHGRRLTLWKKGWNSRAPHTHANSLLNIEAFGWASDRGYATFDFVSLDLGIADALLLGAGLTESQRRSRDMFHLRLGAVPRLLPPARLYVVDSGLRRLYNLCCRWRPLERWVMRRLGGGLMSRW